MTLSRASDTSFYNSRLRPNDVGKRGWNPKASWTEIPRVNVLKQTLSSEDLNSRITLSVASSDLCLAKVTFLSAYVLLYTLMKSSAVPDNRLKSEH